MTVKEKGKRDNALQAIARVAAIRANKGKHGPLFGEITAPAAAEIVGHFFDELLDRVLKKGERVWLINIGTFYVASHKGTTKRADVTHRLAFSASDAHRGLPKKGGAA